MRDIPGQMRRHERVHGVHPVQKVRDPSQHDGLAGQRSRGESTSQPVVQERADKHIPRAALPDQRRHRDRVQLGRRARSHHERRPRSVDQKSHWRRDHAGVANRTRLGHTRHRDCYRQVGPQFRSKHQLSVVSAYFPTRRAV